MSRRLLLGSGAFALPPEPLDPVDPEPPSSLWPASTDPTVLALRPTGTQVLVTRTATPGDSIDDHYVAISEEIDSLMETTYGNMGPDHCGVLFLPPGEYLGGAGTGKWLSIVGTTGNPEDVVIFSDTIAADGVLHPYTPIYLEGVTLKAGYNAALGQSPKYCAHIAGSARSTFANVIFDAADAKPGSAEFGNTGTVGADGNVGSVITFYRCEFIRSAENVGSYNAMNLHGGPAGILPMSVAFIDCTMPDGAGFGGGGTADGGHDELYVIGGTLGGTITTSDTTDIYTDHPNDILNPDGISGVGTIYRDHTDWPRPDPDSGAGLTPVWESYYYPSSLDAPGTTVARAQVTDAAPMTPMAGRTYYCPVPITTALWLNRFGLQVHAGAGKAVAYRPQPDAGTYYGSIEPGNVPVVESLEAGVFGTGQWLAGFYYTWIRFPATSVGGNRLWFHFKTPDPTGVSIDGSAELPGLHDCYYSDDDGTTLVKATAGTPFPLAHAAQVR